jgi:hypothetical protein
MFEDGPTDLGELSADELSIDELVASDVDAPAADRLLALAALPPSGLVLAALTSIDPARLPVEERLIWLQTLYRCQAYLAAMEANGLVALAGRRTIVDEYVVASADSRERTVRIEDAVAEEVAAASRMAPRTARHRIDAARTLVGPLAPLHAALLGGHVGTGHVAAIVRQVARLPRALGAATLRRDGGDDPEFVEQCKKLLERVLPFAATHTPAETERKTRGLVEQVDPAEAERRRQYAKSQCGVDVMDDVDGQSVLSARMSTVDAHAVFDAVRRLAGDDDFQPECAPSSGQRHIEALKALVLGPAMPDAVAGGAEVPIAGVLAAARVNAHIGVVVSLETILGLSDAPGTVAGSGAIGASAVRELVTECGTRSSLYRLVADPDGALLDVGRLRYQVSDAQRAFVSARDVTCRFPGCGVRATRCQVDHAIAWEDGGPTDAVNLGALCIRHHNLKTHSGWKIISTESDGSCVWRSPRQRRYQRERAEIIPAAQPPPAGPSPF